jgi:hypothetical protein
VRFSPRASTPRPGGLHQPRCIDLLEQAITTYQVGFSLLFRPDEVEEFDFAAVLDRFYEELLAIEEREPQLTDPDLAASLAELTADVLMEIDATSFIDAQVCGASLIRAALHTIEMSAATSAARRIPGQADEAPTGGRLEDV